MTSSYTVAARVLDPELDLDVISATITLDESWTPYVQATLVCAYGNLVAAAALRALDPRELRYVEVTLTQTATLQAPVSTVTDELGGLTAGQVTARWQGKTVGQIGAHFDPPFDGVPRTAPRSRRFLLVLRGRDIDEADATVTITLASEESLLQDDAHISPTTYRPALWMCWEAVDLVLYRIGRVRTHTSPQAEATAIGIDAGRDWVPGTTAYDWIAGILRVNGLHLWADQAGEWWLWHERPADTSSVTVAAGTNALQLGSSISRDHDWYTAAVLTYQWTDLDGPHEQRDVYVREHFPARVYTETIQRPYPGPGRARAAVDAFWTRTGQAEVVGIADVTATPGGIVVIGDTYTAPRTARIAAVTWQIPADTMTIRTREDS